jgi:hypothetical protein
VTLKATRISWLAGLAMIAPMSLVPATAQVSPSAPCPAGYWHYGSLCFDESTGDVVLASAAPVAVTEPGCRLGYWRMDTVCVNLTTGDVELAEAATQSAQAGK